MMMSMMNTYSSSTCHRKSLINNRKLSFLRNYYVLALTVLANPCSTGTNTTQAFLATTTTTLSFGTNAGTRRLPISQPTRRNELLERGSCLKYPIIDSSIKSLLFHRSTSNALNNNIVRLMSSSASSSPDADIVHIGTEEMEEILEDYEKGGREESQYCVIDVRTDSEVLSTGKLSPSIYTLPVQVIMNYNVFALDDDEFEEVCGFTKPTPDETLVFTCAAGIRSVYACQFAAKAGYSKLINYTGGSSQWFSTMR